MLMGVQSHLAANLWRKCLDEIPDLSSIMRGTWYGRVANTCYTLYSILSLGGLLQTCVQPELFFGRPCMIILWPHPPGNNWNLRIETDPTTLLEKQSKFLRKNMKCRGKHELFSVVSRFPRYISCYITESRLSLGQCTTGANATEYVRLFILRVYNIYVVCIGFYAEL